MAEIAYSLALLGCSLGMAGLGWRVWRRHRQDPVARRFVVFCLVAAVWLFLHTPDVLTRDLGTRLLLFQVRTAILIFYFTATLGLVLAFTGHGEWLEPKRYYPLLAIIPAASALLVLTSQFHSWFIADYPLEDAGVRLRMSYARQIGFNIFLLCSYGCVLACCAWLARSLPGRPLRFDIAAPKTAEPRFRNLFERHQATMLLIEPGSGAIIDANAAASAFYGFPVEVLRRMRIQDINCLPPEQVAAERESAKAEQRNYFIFPHRLASGEIRTVEVHSTPVEVGGQVLLFSIIHDITERGRAEEALRFTQFVIDHLPDAVLWATSDGHFVYANDAACQSLGYSREELLNMKVTDIDLALVKNPWASQWLEFKNSGSMTFESQSLRKNGEVFPTEVRTLFVEFKGEEYACGIVRDISERKRAEEVLRAKVQTEAVERQQRAILEHLPVGTLLAAGPGREVLYLNPRFVEMFGYTREQIPDIAHWWPLAYPDPGYRQALMEEWDRRMAGTRAGQTVFEPLEATITARDGSAKRVGVHTSLMDELCFVTFIDLTERQQAEEARRERDAAEAASKAKSRFLATMSHEIRTPLNAILGFAQILERDSGLDAEQRDKLTVIRRSGQHLLDLINSILDMAKIEAGRMSLRSQLFDLNRLLSDLQALFRQRAEERGLALVFEADGLPRLVEGDEMRLRQILINLLSNAIKFTPAGSVALRAKAEIRGLCFCVEDTGMGIAPEEMERLFEPFNQTASGLKIQEGTGLGLALSRQLVRLMGGELEVRSRAGRGSLFFFTLPLRSADEGQHYVGTADQPAYAAALSKAEVAERLSRYPDDWRALLRAALDRGDPARIAELTAPVEGRDAELYRVLARWAHDCDHEAFLDALGEDSPD